MADKRNKQEAGKRWSVWEETLAKPQYCSVVTLHYAAIVYSIESNRELNKSFRVIALFLLIFGPNLIIIFFYWCKTVNIFQEKISFP